MIKKLLRPIFFVSKIIFFIYSWAALSLISIDYSLTFANTIFYSGLIYGILWLFEKQFAECTKDDEVKG